MQLYSESTISLSTFTSSPCATTSTGGLTQSDYWNIDDILAEEELVPTVFQHESHGLSHLLLQLGTTPSAGTQQVKTQKHKAEANSNQVIPKDSRVDLPVWLATLMAQRDIVALMKPLFLTQKFFK